MNIPFTHDGLRRNTPDRRSPLESGPVIITSSPLRISLGGGGTDLPSYYREHAGFLIAAIGVSGVAITHRPSSAPATHVTAAQSNGVSLVGVSDLSDDNLEQLIQSMDNLDATPPAEPDPEPAAAAGGGSA